MSDTVRVFVAQSLSDEKRAQLQDISPRIQVSEANISSAQELEQALPADTEVLFAHHYGRFNVASDSALRWVQVPSAGVNHLRDTSLWNSDILITSGNGVHAVQISEYVLATILAHFHDFPFLFRLQERSEWPSHGNYPHMVATELRGLTVGILGYGAIGREVARLVSALGMRVLATKRIESSPQFNGWTPQGTGDADGLLPEQYYALDELHDLLAASDVVVLTLPLTDATRHIIGAAELAAMRSNALIVNIGRGPLIDQQALIKALQEKRIGGAALDVTDPEPLPSESELWKLENTIITPHISGWGNHTDDRALDLFADNLRRYLAGEELFNIVSRENGY